MSEYFSNKKKSERKTKTHVALQNVLHDFLSRQRFSKISVNELCKAALISRSTFYVYFDDKFDLLEYCLTDLKNSFELYILSHNEKEIIAKINYYIFSHSTELKNLLLDNSVEVVFLLTEMLTPGFSNMLTTKEKQDHELSLSHTILANFCAGGFLNLILWQLKNGFSVEPDIMTQYLYNMQKGITALDLEHNDAFD